jgi:hypothetical protein
MALNLPQNPQIGGTGHVPDTGIILDAIRHLDSVKVEDLAIGTVTTGPPGSSALASIHPGPGGIHTLDLTVPRGSPGTGTIGDSSSITTLNVDPDVDEETVLLVRDDRTVVAIPPEQAVRPSPPSDFTSAVTLSYFRISWNTVQGAASYYVYRDGVFLVKVESASVDSASYRDTSIVVDTDYSYTVRSANSQGMRGAESPPLVLRANSADNVAPVASITRWPLVNRPGQKQIIRVAAVDVDAQALALTLDTDIGLLESTADPSVWYLTV